MFWCCQGETTVFFYIAQWWISRRLAHKLFPVGVTHRPKNNKALLGLWSYLTEATGFMASEVFVYSRYHHHYTQIGENAFRYIVLQYQVNLFLIHNLDYFSAISLWHFHEISFRIIFAVKCKANVPGGKQSNDTIQLITCLLCLMNAVKGTQSWYNHWPSYQSSPDEHFYIYMIDNSNNLNRIKINLLGIFRLYLAYLPQMCTHISKRWNNFDTFDK